MKSVTIRYLVALLGLIGLTIYAIPVWLNNFLAKFVIFVMWILLFLSWWKWSRRSEPPVKEMKK